jgi:sugar phosphate isomerase/epimerase
MAGKVRLTMLNAMAGPEFPAAVGRHVALGLKWLDLKDSIFGKGVIDLTDDEAREVRRLADAKGLGVWCMSTTLFYADVESGEEAFRRHLASVDRAVAIARILQPRMIRILAAKTSRRAEIADSTEHIRRRHPWLIVLYAEAVDRIARAGFTPGIENEVHGCIWSTPAEVTSFFAALDRPAARLIWDVQNLWQMGTSPSVEVFRSLRALIGNVHLKGGMSERPGGPLAWSSALADASWPVVEVVRAVIADGASPVLCLNPSHGEARPGYDYQDVAARDIAFLRTTFPEIE